MSTTDIDSAAANGMEGLEIENLPDASKGSFTELQLSELERQILDLYDRLEELQLEIGLLSAPEATQGRKSTPRRGNSRDLTPRSSRRGSHGRRPPSRAAGALRSQSALCIKEEHYRGHPGGEPDPESRACWLKCQSYRTVCMATHPHYVPKANPASDLLPLIQQRDDASTELAATAAQVLAARDALTAAEAERVVLARSNTALAGTMIALAEQVERQKKGDITDPEMCGRIEELEREVRKSRQRWRLMKGVASGVVAGSGMDWARDEKLRALVLEEDSEGEE